MGKKLKFALWFTDNPRLRQLAEFRARNLTFVEHIALMGLKITGFTRANLDSLSTPKDRHVPCAKCREVYVRQYILGSLMKYRIASHKDSNAQSEHIGTDAAKDCSIGPNSASEG
jgi:hypothetical protein